MGTRYVYKGNNDPHELTEKITGLGEDKTEELVVGGSAKELTDEQYARLSARYRLVPEGSDNDEPSVVPTGDALTPDPDGESGDSGAGETSTPEPSASASSGAGRRGGRQA